MSDDSLPIQVNPFRLADKATKLCGSVLVKNMPRLVPSLMTDEGEVQATLDFGVDQQGIRNVKAHFETSLTLQCQRCMESFVQEITSDFVLGIVASETEAERLPDRYEPLIAVDNSLLLLEMIEEELIISLPIVPMHNDRVCKVKTPIVIADNTQATNGVKENPFKVIESLKGKKTE